MGLELPQNALDVVAGGCDADKKKGGNFLGTRTGRQLPKHLDLPGGKWAGIQSVERRLVGGPPR